MKKLLSLLLCLVLAFGTLPAVYAADEAEEAEVIVNADLDAMKAIGIFDGALTAGQPLTRRQLADIYFKIVLPEQSDDEYISTTFYFDDILESDFAINIVHEMGIMNGSGERIFSPDAYVSYTQLVKTLVDFLGYKEKAEAYGGYPNGYLLVASEFDFDDYAPQTPDMVCTPEMAACIFRLALDVDMQQLIWTEANGDKHYLKKGENYLEVYTKVYFNEGIITSTYVEDTYKYSNTGYFDIRIDNEAMLLSDDVLSMNELLGYRVNYFYKLNEHDDKEIIYYEIVDTDIIDFERDVLDDAKTNTEYIYYYNDSGKLKKLDISEAYIFYNGTLCTSYTAETINPFGAEDIDGFIRAVSTDGNSNDAEYLFIETFRSYIVDTIQGDHILNRYHPDVIFDIDDITNGDVVVKNVLGEVIDPASMKEYDVFNVFTDKNGDIKKIIITVDSYTGTVERITKKDGTKISSLTISGFEFEVSSNFYLNPEVKDLKVGDKIKIYFNHLKKISDIVWSDYNSSKYGYIINADSFNALNSTVKIEMLTSKNTIEAIPLADKVILNDRQKTDEEVLAFLGRPAARQVCMYDLNKEGTEIISLTTVDSSLTSEQDGFRQLPALTNNFWRSSSFNGVVLMSGSTILFVVPNEENRNNKEMYLATDTSYLPDGSQKSGFQTSFVAYGTKAYDPTAVAAVYTVANIEESRSVSYTPLVVCSTTSEYNTDTNSVEHTVTAYSSGSLVTYPIKEEAMYCGDGGEKISVGDIIRISKDTEGVINNATIAFDASAWKLASSYTSNPTANYTSQTDSFDNRYAVGTVYWKNNFAVTLKIEPMGAGDPIYESYAAGLPKIYEYSKDSRGNETITAAGTTALRDYVNNGISSKVVMVSRNGTPTVLLVCND